MLEPGQTHGITNGTAIVDDRFTSAWTSITDATQKVADDYAVNGVWTVTSVTSDPGGDIIVISGTGLNNTDHVRTCSPEMPMLHAYVCLAAGGNAATDGVLIDTDDMIGRLLVEGVRFGELKWPIDRTVDLSGSTANQQPSLCSTGRRSRTCKCPKRTTARRTFRSRRSAGRSTCAAA